MDDSEFLESHDQVVNERRAHVAAFISGELHFASNVLSEQKRAQEALEEFESRRYQHEAWGQLWKAREDGKTEALIHLATGLGKTSIGVLDYAKFRSEMREEHPDVSLRALFVVNQRPILKQAGKRFKTFMPEMSQSRFSWNNQKPETELTLATFQALVKSGHSLPPDYFDYIIYDEAHHIEADTYKQVVEYFKPKFQLGMTATPERMDNRDITKHFGEAVYSKTLPEAIRENLLSQVEYKVMVDDTVEEALNSGFEPHSIREMKELFNVKLRNHEIINEIKDAQAIIRERDSVEAVKTIIFCENIDHVDIIAESIEGKAYHSGIKTSERDALMESFLNGEFENIVVRDMLNEGVDIPDARLIVMIRSTESKTVFEQQIGRGLRKTNNKDRVTVLDFVGNIERLVMLNELMGDIFEEDIIKSEALPQDEDDTIIGNNYNSFIFSQKAVDALMMYEKMHERYAANKWHRMSNEQIVNLALEISPDKPLTIPELERLETGTFPNLAVLYKRFGSMYGFYEACGFRTTDWTKSTREQIIARALELSPTKPMTMDEIIHSGVDEFPSVARIRALFGTVTEFQRMCGFDVLDWDKYSNDDLVRIALEVSPDAPLTIERLRILKKGILPNPATLRRRFGSLVEFQRQCGFGVSVDWNEYDNQDLIDRALQISPNKPLTMADISKLERTDFPNPSILYERFGSMIKFHEACGFKVRPRWEDYTNEQLVELALTISPDKPLGSADMDALDKTVFPSKAFLYKRFGKVGRFHEACGFTAKILWHEWSDEDIAALARSISPDRPFNPKLADQQGIDEFPSADTIYSRYGSFLNFNLMCGYDIEVPKNWSDVSNDELIAIAKELSPDKYFGQVMINNVDRKLFPSASYIKKRFGSFDNYKKASGY